MGGGELEQVARILKILLCKTGPITISNLGAKAGMPFNMSKPMIKRLEKNGFVELSHGTIGRKKKMKITFVAITKKGLDLLKDFENLKKLMGT